MLTVRPSIKGFSVNLTPNTELDIAGYVTHASTSSGFTPSSSNLVKQGPDTNFTCQVPYSGNVYVRTAAYDTFEDETNINYSGLNYSSEQIVLVNQTNPLDNVAPATPTGVAAVGAVDITGQTDTATITVSWNAVTDTDLDLDGYSILLKVGTATTYTEFNTGKAYTSYKISNLTPATDYSVCVASYDKWGNLSAYSGWATVAASTIKDSTVPAAPTSVVASGGFDTIAVTITATKPTDWASYEIQLATNVGFTAGLQTVISTASVTTIKASAGTYYVRARCRDRADNASATWTNSTAFPVSTALTLPSSLYNELRTDFLVNNVLFKFGRTGDVSYPTDTSLYVVSSSGALIWKNTTYNIATTTLTNAYNSYIVATCSGSTATLSVSPLTTDLTALASNVVVIAVTSPSKQPDTNGNYICYVRNGNSLELEGVLIRNASISTAQIKSLDVGDAVISGTLNVNRLGASSLTADKFAAGVMGNVCAGRTVGGTGGASTIPTDGTKTIGSGWYGFGTGSQNNNAAEGAYVEIDLGVPRKLGKIDLYFYYPDERYYYYKVKYSTDGATWYYAAGTSANTGWVTSPTTSGLTTGSVLPTVIQLPSIQTAKYIRVYGNGNSVTTTNGVYEIEAYEYGVYITGSQIMTGSLSAATEVLVGTDASGTIKLSGTNNRIEVRKAGDSFDRVQIGKLASGSYGIILKNDVGDALLTSDGSIDGAKVKNLYVNGNAMVGGSVTIGAGTLTYSNGATVDSLRPAAAGADTTATILGTTGTLTLNAALTINSLLTISGYNAGITSGLTSYNEASTTGFWISKGGGNAAFRVGSTDSFGNLSSGFMWDGSAASFAGKVTFGSSSSGYSNIADRPTSLASINATESSTLSTASINAASALVAAGNAQSAADTANSLLSDIASDSKLTPTEKQDVRKEWDSAASEKTLYDAQADAFSITSEKSSYAVAFNSLGTYLNGGSTWASGIPVWISDANLNTTTSITGSTFRSTWKAYYDARTSLLNAIATKASTMANVTDSAITTVARPLGGSYVGASSVTGAIKVTLPVLWTNTMIQFSVDVYNYQVGTSFTVLIGGYNNTTSGWIQTSASILGGSASNYTVRFGHDGTHACVWIGETTTVWSYVKVTVKNLTVSYLNYSLDTWSDGWAVSVASTLGTIQFTDTNNLVHASDVINVDGSPASTVRTNAALASGWMKPTTTLIDGNKIYTGDAYVDTLQIKGEAVLMTQTTLDLNHYMNTSDLTTSNSGERWNYFANTVVDLRTVPAGVGSVTVLITGSYYVSGQFAAVQLEVIEGVNTSIFGSYPINTAVNGNALLNWNYQQRSVKATLTVGKLYTVRMAAFAQLNYGVFQPTVQVVVVKR